MKAGDRYLKIVEWSEEDGCYVGRCPGLMHGGVHGSDEEEVYRELCRAAGEVIEIRRRHGGPLPPATARRSFSGRFVLRLPSELHEALAIRALARHESLNGHVCRLLTEAVGWSATEVLAGKSPARAHRARPRRPARKRPGDS